MPKLKSARRRKKVKFKKILFKLTSGQHTRLMKYCLKHNLTPVRVIKKAINVYLDRFGPVIDHSRTIVSKNQLTIFDDGADMVEEVAQKSLVPQKAGKTSSVK